MIKKFTVIWLLCLFVWNVALAEVPSLLLCLHDDFAVHVETEACHHGHCEDGDGHSESKDPAICSVTDHCTDLELQGGESIPARLNEVHTVDLPAIDMALFSYVEQSPRFTNCVQQFMPPLRGPPGTVSWLTDLYLQKTVLRV